MDLEASSRRDGPATACEERALGPRWMLEQDDQGPGSDIEVRTSCGGRRRGDSSMISHGSSMEDNDRFFFSLLLACIVGHVWLVCDLIHTPKLTIKYFKTSESNRSCLLFPQNL